MGIPKLVVLCFIVHSAIGQRMSPVILVPGLGGSQLQAKLDNKPSVPQPFCKRTSDWFDMWLNPKMYELNLVECFVDNARLNYDVETRRTSSPEGVKIRVPNFGDPSVVEYLSPTIRTQALEYFAPIVEALVAQGWSREQRIRAAPYDFRKGPNENRQWFDETKYLIEDTFAKNQNVPVTIICHAMGCTMSHLFLTRQTDAWKEKYIAHFITLSAAWGGTVQTLKTFAVGGNLGFPIVKRGFILPLLRSMPSLAFNLPSSEFWNKSEILVHTPHKDYTLADLKDFFGDIKYPIAWEMAKDQAPYISELTKPPRVQVHCIYGIGTQTAQMLKYYSDVIENVRPFLAPDDGDGTINIRSLRGCLQWRDQQEKLVEYLELPKVSHMDILFDKNTIDYILQVLEKYDLMLPQFESEEMY